jgi:hypothetical protein
VRTDEQIEIDVDLTISPVCDGWLPSERKCDNEAAWQMRLTCEMDARRTPLACDDCYQAVRARPFRCRVCYLAGRGDHLAWVITSWRL